jgi:hypothetical protein
MRNAARPPRVRCRILLYPDTTQDRIGDAFKAGTGPFPGQAMAFAQHVLDTLAGDHPPGFTLDVAELTDGSWTVVKANSS